MLPNMCVWQELPGDDDDNGDDDDDDDDASDVTQQCACGQNFQVRREAEKHLRTFLRIF